MITRENAVKIAEEHLAEKQRKNLNTLVLLFNETIAFEYGWVFFFQNKRYLETGNLLDKLGGNSPIIINKQDGGISEPGTGHRIEYYLENYIKG